jgi:DNA-binding HxlR family transcriptional regulator
MAREGPNGAETALEAALARVGDRWSLLVVEALLGGSRRWRELQESVPGIAPNILSDRLKRLEREAVITARPYSERPVRMMYELTGAGQELAGALRLLADWGARRSPVAEPLRHTTCGTPMEARWFCSTCARPVSEEEAQEVRYV